MPNTPAKESPHKVPERGYGMGYQESVKIEARCLFGMEPDEFYRRQTGLVLDTIPPTLTGNSQNLSPNKIAPEFKFPDGTNLETKAKKAKMKLVDRFGLDLKSGDHILDLAVGEGDTSRYLASTGASVEARDIESYLVNQGKKRDSEIRKATEEVKSVQNTVRESARLAMGSVNYAQGDYSKIKESVNEKDQFSAITCLSRSFIYLGERENYVKALRDFYDLLAPGGKVVLQSRKNIASAWPPPWLEETDTDLEITPHEVAMTDKTTGTKFVWRIDQSISTLSDGIKQHTGSRYLQYKDGSTKELGQVICDDHLDFDNLEGMGAILREAGFKNLQLKVENLSRNGSEIMYAIVAEKPRGPRVRAYVNSVAQRIKKLLPSFSPKQEPTL